jgi:hypothetical protein
MAFHQLFRAALQRSGLTQAALAEASDDYDSNVNAVVRGKRPPPLHRLPRWADLLKLNDAERLAFFSAGIFCNLPAELQTAQAELLERYPATMGFLAEHHPQVAADLAQAETRHQAKRLADLEADNAELRQRINAAVAALSTAAPTRVSSERPRLSAEIDAIDIANRHAATAHAPTYDQPPPDRPA